MTTESAPTPSGATPSAAGATDGGSGDGTAWHALSTDEALQRQSVRSRPA